MIMRLTSKVLYEHEAAGAAEAASHSPSQIAVDFARGELWLPEDLQRKARQHRTTQEELRKTLSDAANSGKSMYDWRNRLLIFGFVALLASRIVPFFTR